MKYLSSWMLFESRDPNDIRKFNKKEKLTVYHRTEDEIVSKVGRDGFRSGGGNAWGDGIYACYDLISTTKKNPYNEGGDRVNTYGPVIIESEVVSLKDYLIFDYDVAKQYFGKNYDIITQIKNLVPEEVFESNKKTIENAHKICLSHRDNPLGENKYTSDAVREIYDIDAIMDHVRGLVFTGGWDGKVLLSYDRENLIPIRYSKDNGKNWKKLTEKGAYKAAKDNFSKLISNESDVEKIKDKIKDRINNTITTKFGPEKNLKNLDFNELRNIKSEFSYIYQKDDQAAEKSTKEYEDYKKTLSVVRKEIDEVFSVAATGVKSNLFNFIEKINWSDDIFEIIKSVNKNLDFTTMYRDFKDDTSVTEKLDEMKKKISDIYIKELRKNLTDISKDENFFIKYIEFSKKYKYIVTTVNEKLLQENTSLDIRYNFFDSVIEEIFQRGSNTDIIKNISENLEKKVINFFNNYENRGDVSRISTKKPKNEIFTNIDFEIFSKEYSFLEFYKLISSERFDLEEILEFIKNGRRNFYDIDYNHQNLEINDITQKLKSSIIKIANFNTKKFEQLNQNIEKLFNAKKSYNSDYTYYSFTQEYHPIWTNLKNNEYGNFSHFILFISLIEDRSILEQLTKEGFLKEKTSKILKMLPLEPISITKSDFGKDKKIYLEFTDLQKSESNKIFESEFNNPEFITVFKATLLNEKNFRCFKKLKLEGKDVSNWTNWIKIYLLDYIVSFSSSVNYDLYIQYHDEKLKEKYSLDKVLDELINLNLNVFSKNFIESEEMKNTANEPNYTIRNIFQSFTSRLEDNQSLINKHFQYLDKIKDNTDKEIYYCYIFSLIHVLKEGENFDKLIKLVDTQSLDFFNIFNNNNMSFNYNNELLIFLLQKNIISISDCIKNNLNSGAIEKFSNYKLRKIIEENNLEKIKSFLDFLKQNNIYLDLRDGESNTTLSYKKLDFKLLPVEAIEKMIENEQIEFYQLSDAIGKNDELVRKLLKFVNKDGFNKLLDSIEDPKLKEEIMIKTLEASNDFDSNFDTFEELGPKKVNLEKLIKDLNLTTEKNDYFVQILLITLATDKKDEILNNIDKNIFKNLFTSVGPETESEWQESKKEWGNGKLIELLKKDYPKLVEFLNQKNLNNSLNIIKKYCPEDRKDILQKWIDCVSYTSERIILSYKSFIRI